MSAGSDLRATAERIEGLLGDLGRVADPGARLLAEELMRQLMELYGGGLARIVELAAQPSAPPPTSPFHGDGGLLARFAADDLVASLLILHGLHPDDPETRIRAALERVRPYLGSHGGDVELLGIDSEGRARLRMKGSCQGCPSSAVTIKMAIETAIEEAAPELTGIEVEGLGDTPPAPSPGGRDLVQLGGGAAFHPAGSAAANSTDSNGLALPPAAGAAPSLPPAVGGAVPAPGGPAAASAPAAAPSAGIWLACEAAPALAPGSLAALQLAGVPIVVCRLDAGFYAYRDGCPACGSHLAAAALAGEILTCPGCGRRYDVRRAGSPLPPANGHEAGPAAGSHLHPLPLLAERGEIRIAVPAAAG